MDNARHCDDHHRAPYLQPVVGFDVVWCYCYVLEAWELGGAGPKQHPAASHAGGMSLVHWIPQDPDCQVP